MLRALLLGLLAVNLLIWLWRHEWLSWAAPLPHEPVIAAPAADVSPQSITPITATEAKQAEQLQKATDAAMHAPPPPPSEPAPVRASAPDYAAVPATAAPAAPATAAAPAATRFSSVCLQTAALGEAEERRARRTLQGIWPEGEWRIAAATIPATYLLYHGPHKPDIMLLAKKIISGKNVPFTEAGDDLNLVYRPGLILGRFASRAEAEAGRGRMLERGIRAAWVLELPPQFGHRFLLRANSEAQLHEVLQQTDLEDWLDGGKLSACSAAEFERAANP